nr:hypothetical protein [Paraburkholderia aromaticivorans]
MRRLKTVKRGIGTTKIVEPEHGSGAPLDHAVVLFDQIVQVHRLADIDWFFALGVDGFQPNKVDVRAQGAFNAWKT